MKAVYKILLASLAVITLVLLAVFVVSKYVSGDVQLAGLYTLTGIFSLCICVATYFSIYDDNRVDGNYAPTQEELQNNADKYREQLLNPMKPTGAF